MKEHIFQLHEIIPFSEIGFSKQELNKFTESLYNIDQYIEKIKTLKINLNELLTTIINKNDNTFIYDKYSKNNFKKYYIDCSNIISEKLKIEEDIKIINLENFISCAHEIKKENLNQPTNIINYMDEKKKQHYEKIRDIHFEINEQTIKNQCELFLNNKSIPLNTQYIFQNEGNYNIKILFKESFMNLSCLLYECSSITHLDLSNFNISKIKNMNAMFWKCSSLISLDLSNFITIHTENMGTVFSFCSNLKNLNISNFITNNTKIMNGMFFGCHSLKELDLSNFNTEKSH